jgi:hypothetical protein
MNINIQIRKINARHWHLNLSTRPGLAHFMANVLRQSLWSLGNYITLVGFNINDINSVYCEIPGINNTGMYIRNVLQQSILIAPHAGDFTFEGEIEGDLTLSYLAAATGLKLHSIDKVLLTTYKKTRIIINLRYIETNYLSTHHYSDFISVVMPCPIISICPSAAYEFEQAGIVIFNIATSIDIDMYKVVADTLAYLAELFAYDPKEHMEIAEASQEKNSIPLKIIILADLPLKSTTLKRIAVETVQDLKDRWNEEAARINVADKKDLVTILNSIGIATDFIIESSTTTTKLNKKI